MEFYYANLVIDIFSHLLYDADTVADESGLNRIYDILGVDAYAKIPRGIGKGDLGCLFTRHWIYSYPWRCLF